MVTPSLDERSARLYVQRVSDRWPVEHAYLDGPHPETEPPYVVVFVSRNFDGVPWLERVRQAGALWDAAEMGGQADVHCYTPVELERKRSQLAVVRDAVADGMEVLAPSA
jgi:hypothetical protein